MYAKLKMLCTQVRPLPIVSKIWYVRIRYLLRTDLSLLFPTKFTIIKQNLHLLFHTQGRFFFKKHTYLKITVFDFFTIKNPAIPTNVLLVQSSCGHKEQFLSTIKTDQLDGFVVSLPSRCKSRRGGQAYISTPPKKIIVGLASFN